MAENKNDNKTLQEQEMQKLREQFLEEIRAEAKAEAKAEAAKILEAAQAQADEIISKAAAVTEEKATAETEEQIAYANELVKVKLFKDKGKYAADVVAIHNGKAYQIQRGKEVEIPRKVAQIIADSEAQKGYTADIIEEYKAEGAEAETKLA